MARIGIAVEQLDGMVRALHEGIIDALPRDHTTHRHGAGIHRLGKADHVRCHAKALGSKSMAKTTEAGDHFVEYQKNAMLVANLTNPLQIAFWWRQHACGPCHRLDNDGGNG